MKFIFQGRNLNSNNIDIFILLCCDVEPDSPHKYTKSNVLKWAERYDPHYQIFNNLSEARYRSDLIKSKGKFTYIIPEFLYFV